MRRILGIHALALVMATASCERGQLVSGVSDSAFIAAMVELRRIQENPSLDSAARDAARAMVLQSRGLSPADMERAARAIADDPRRASEIIQTIDRRVSGDTTAGPGPGARRRR